MLRKLLLSAVGTALMIGVFGGPAAALDPAPARVLLINGIPSKVDICFGKTEAVSNLRYGRAAVWEELLPGSYRYVVRLAKVGKCTGKLLGFATKTFASDGNYSLVIWRAFRKVSIKQFTNDVSLEAADRPTISVRHAARNPATIDVWLWEHVRPFPSAFEPTIGGLRRGNASAPIAVRPGQYSADIYASRRTRAFDWAGYWSEAEPGTATALYLIGTSKATYRVVGFSQEGEVAVP